MTDDEEALRIAQELTRENWDTLRLNISGLNGYSASMDDPLLEKGLIVLKPVLFEQDQVILTPLGRAVWEWHGLFWDGIGPYD